MFNDYLPTEFRLHPSNTARRLTFYHDECFDGSVCAAIVADTDGAIVPYKHGFTRPVENLTSKFSLVVFVDCCPTVEQLQELAEEHADVLVLDHHISTRELIENFPEHPLWDTRKASAIGDYQLNHFSYDGKARAVFITNMKLSGAQITYDAHIAFRTALPDNKRPWVVDYSADRDLWKWQLPRTHEINAFLRSIPYDDIPRWQELLNRRVISPIMYGIGAAVMETDANNMEMIRKNAYLAVIKTCVRKDSELVIHNTIPIVAVNTQRPYVSDILNDLLDEHSGVEAAIAWFQSSAKSFTYSVRSRNGMAVKIAKSFGGGGHADAAGFKSSCLEILTVDDE